MEGGKYAAIAKVMLQFTMAVLLPGDCHGLHRPAARSRLGLVAFDANVRA